MPEPEVVSFVKQKKITLDLSEYPELYDRIKEIAHREMRSVNNQLIYWLFNNIDQYMGFEKGEKR